MKVRDLIAALQTMPPDAEVLHLWDGAPRTAIEHVWLARGGFVVTADYGAYCSPVDALPAGEPDPAPGDYWHAPRR